MLAGLLLVPEGRRVSELERLRTPPTRASGRVMTAELRRIAEIGALHAGAVRVEPVPMVKMTALARYGLASKAPTLRDLEDDRKAATLLATVRHLETSSVDDALDVLDLLITSNLLARAERAGKAEQLRTFPKLRSAARTMASAMEVLMSAPEATADRLVSLVEVWKAIEEVVPRERLAAAVETVAAFVPVTDDDAAAEWRAELVKRYRTVQGFIELLLEVIRFRAVAAGRPVLAMVRTAAAMAKSRRRHGPGDIAAHEPLITGSWRPLVYRNPDLPEGQIDKAAFMLCAVMHLHQALRRRDVFAEGADRWSDPRARLLEGAAWEAARPKILTIVFGLFAICGYQFSPRIADLGDTRLWRTNTRAVYGPLDAMSRHTIRRDRIRAHWCDMLRVAGSLTMGTVRAYDLIRMLSADGRTTGLGDAFAHYGRIFKTLHLLQFISDSGYRRMIGTQLNFQEGLHRLARKICFGNRGQLRQRYREGMENQLGTLGLALNAVVWWNTLYLDAAVKQLREQGFPATEDMCARLSPIRYDHINFLGRYAFTRADLTTGLRPFHEQAANAESY